MMLNKIFIQLFRVIITTKAQGLAPVQAHSLDQKKTSKNIKWNFSKDNWDLVVSDNFLSSIIC